MYAKYKDFVDKHIDITQEEWEHYKSKMSVVHYKKGQIVYHAGNVCNKISGSF